jgi:hypothetical protein
MKPQATATTRDTTMIVSKRIDWKAEQERFMLIAYPRALRAARKAFSSWHPRKRDDAIGEMIAKVWATWTYNIEKGKDPLVLLSANIRFAVLFVRYDRRVAGRGSHPDVFDYRSKMTRQHLSPQGQASPSERSDPDNSWIDWTQSSGDDPAELAAALEEVGMTSEEYHAA